MPASRRALDDPRERFSHPDQTDARAKPGHPLGGAASAAARLLSAWLPAVLWAGMIFAFSSIPDLSSGLGTWDTVLRKLAHTAEYAVLGALLLRALVRELPAFTAGVAYAVSDEIHQHFVAGRHGAPIDVAVDAFGVLLGILVLARARR